MKIKQRTIGLVCKQLGRMKARVRRRLMKIHRSKLFDGSPSRDYRNWVIRLRGEEENLNTDVCSLERNEMREKEKLELRAAPCVRICFISHDEVESHTVWVPRLWWALALIYCLFSLVIFEDCGEVEMATSDIRRWPINNKESSDEFLRASWTTLESGEEA